MQRNVVYAVRELSSPTIKLAVPTPETSKRPQGFLVSYGCKGEICLIPVIDLETDIAAGKFNGRVAGINRPVLVQGGEPYFAEHGGTEPQIVEIDFFGAGCRGGIIRPDVVVFLLRVARVEMEILEQLLIEDDIPAEIFRDLARYVGRRNFAHGEERELGVREGPINEGRTVSGDSQISRGGRTDFPKFRSALYVQGNFIGGAPGDL